MMSMMAQLVMGQERMMLEQMELEQSMALGQG